MRISSWCWLSGLGGGVLLVVGDGGTAARAAGYALKEQSATAQGNAFAGATAGAEDPSFMFFNPASLGYRDRFEAQAVTTYVAPHAKLEDASASTIQGVPIGGSDSVDDVAENAVVPAFYGVAPLPYGVRLGLGINVPFGLETNYPDRWVGRYHAIQTRLQTVNINPAIAWRPIEQVSLAFGFQAQHVDGKLTNAVDFGTIGALSGIPFAQPGQQDGSARVDGDDWGFGYTAGIIVEPVKGTRIGAAYRSEIDQNLKGRLKFQDDQAGIASLIRSSTGAFADTDASLDVTTPASFSIGIHQDLTPKVAVMAEAQWTDWSSFQDLRIKFDNPAQPDSVTEEKWHDSWFLALGGTWRPLDTLTLRGGIAYDQSPVNDPYRTPRIPDENRYWLSFGLGWEPRPWFGIDASLTHIFVSDSHVDLAADEPGNATRGNLKADYESHIDLVGLSARLRF